METENRTVGETDTESKAENGMPSAGRLVKGKSGETVMAVDASSGLQVETEAEREKRELLNLRQSLRVGRVLKGKMAGVETTAEGPIAVIFYESFKVIIRANDLLPNFAANGKISLDNAYLAAIMNHIGAEIEFIVKGIDEENRLVVASRSEAMAVRRKLFDNKDDDGLYIFCKESIHEARIVSVVKPGVFVELNGFETFVPSSEISWSRVDDPTALREIKVGNTIMVYIAEIKRDPKTCEVTELSLSIKKATKNPTIREFALVSKGSTLVGVVQYIDPKTASIYVGIANSSQVKCEPLRSRELPAIGTRVRVYILDKDEKRYRIYGRIVGF